MFVLPGSHPLCFGINARHSLLSQSCASPPWRSCTTHSSPKAVHLLPGDPAPLTPLPKLCISSLEILHISSFAGGRSRDSLATRSCLASSLPCPGASGASLLSLQLQQGHAVIPYLSASCRKEPQGNHLAHAHIHRPGTPHILAIRGVAVFYLPFLTLILVFCC